MAGKHLLSTLILSAISLGPAHKAAADAGDAIAGAIVGGIIGNAMAQQQAKKKVYVQKQTVYRTAKPSMTSAQRSENRSVQHALNYFGFSAGTADGVLGRNSRAAISNYQAHMGYAATGQLTQYEKDFLLTSHSRALAGGPATSQMIAANPMGPRGLLITYRDQLATGQQPVATVPAMVPAVVPSTTVVVNPPASVQQPQAAPEPTEVAAAPGGAAPTLPTFAGQSAEASLASHCNAVSLLTNTNGGFRTLDNLSDPDIALNEQFCLARTYAIAASEQMIAEVQGFSPDQITEQCRTIGPLMKDQVLALSLTPLDEVTQQTASFVLDSGMSPAQLTTTAKICLGTGYRIDDLDVALASSLLLVALGERVYTELPGHHLAQGVGTAKREDLALAWFSATEAALANGATPVVAPGQAGRAELIRTAATMITEGTVTPVGGSAAQADQATAIPTFLPAE
ncbi:peptidoglycan-binding domain-containing protein [Tropicimonas marinistellae]|uniref:peptidoglycan-binding domain-containing protein n=1 Tax=Tropicimonas marinistellae TaxID=1739787 RepID=UPI00082E6549|nr:peptidoglycan-binding domain-containing protein [Tropicimonas marinistellae]